MRGTRPVRGVPGADFGIGDVRGSFPGELEVRPLGRPADAVVRVPGSKSITNRALVVAALAEGASEVSNPLFGDDSYWLMDALVRLGFGVRADREAGAVVVEGLGGTIPRGGVEIFVGLAGTVARFLPPVLALGEGPYRVDGVPRMRERPISDLVDAMRGLGAGVEYGAEEGRLPLVVPGGGLRGGEARVEAGKSSQFLSGLLMAAPYARTEEVVLNVAGGRRPYVGITREVMRAFGVETSERTDGGGVRYEVPRGAYRARRYAVEPDASGASYFFAAAALTGGRVRVPGLGASSAQGDLRFVGVLERMGCSVEVGEGSVEVRGPEGGGVAGGVAGGGLRGVEVDMNEFSDTMMTLAAIAPFAEGPTVISGVAHTRLQETDRVSAVAAELTRLGVRVEERQDGLTIHPGPVKPEAPVETHGDHRMARAFALVGLVVPGGVRIKDPACVTKTLPGYFGLLRGL